MADSAIVKYGKIGATLAYLLLLASSVEAAFVDETAARLPADTDDSYDFAVADIDGLGGPDLLVANGGQSRLLINDGSGHFTDETAARIPQLNHKTLAVAFGDVDGVNGPDIFLAGIGQNRLYINDGSGHFTDETPTRLPAATDISMDVAVGDIDGDGDLDFVIANRGSRNQIWINNGTGMFSDQSAARLPLDTDPTYAVALGHANGDAGLDIFFANNGSQNHLLTNDLLGVFSDSTASIPAAESATSDATFADVDGDGDEDVVTADGAGGITLLVNDGSGTFTAAAGQLPAFNTFGIKIGAGDIDFDGSVDLVLASMGQDLVLLNDGSGTFVDVTSSELPADDRRSFGVLLTDADADLDLDLVVATPQGQNRYYDNALAAPRVQTTISPSYIEVGDTVSIHVAAFDEDGVASTTVVIVLPDLTEQAPTDLGAGDYSVVPFQIGDYVVRVTSEDTLGNVVVRDTRFSALANDVTPPTIDTFTIDPTSIIQGQSVTFTVIASDDRAVTATTLTVGGVSVPLNSSGQAVFTPTATGTLAVVAEAVDAAGNSSFVNGAVDVAPDTEFPVVTLNATPDPVDITNPISISASATDNILVSSLGVTVTGPGGNPTDEPVPLNGLGAGTYTPYVPGTYTFTAAATDPAGNETVAVATVEAQGIPDDQAPLVTLTVMPGTTVVGGSVTLTVDATDNVLVVSRTLEINGVPIALDENFQAMFTAPVLGTYTAVATATDPTGNVGSDTVEFTAVDPSTDTDPPQVAITSPVDDAELTSIATIEGTASDLTLVSYELAYAPVGTGDYVVFETGGSQVINGVLGSLDTTILDNGVYEIRLTASDINGLSTSTNVVVNVTDHLKLGNFTVSFRDKSLNIGRLPVDVTRAYDSRQRGTSGDFGYGWSIESTAAVAVENRSPANNWEQTSSNDFIPTYFLSATRPHTVTLKFSEEEQLRFSAQPVPSSQQLYPIQWLDGMNYEPLGEATGTLVPTTQPFVFLNGQILDSSFVPYNPGVFIYTADDGFTYRFDATGQTSLRYPLSQITEPNGVTLTFANGGFTRSDGLSLAFTRDGQNRITRITDPNGNTVDYSYDASGDLVAVTDGAGKTTTFLYDANHYLLEIRDPAGTPLQIQEYDDTGRLTAITDGRGNRVEMEYDTGNNTQIIRDRRGNPTIYEYDGSGNVIEETSLPEIEGVVTPVAISRTFNDDNEILTETNGAGVTNGFTYNTKGQKTSATQDVGGLNLTESFTYDGAGRVLTHTDPRGNTVTSTYDANGNKLSQSDRTGAVTSWMYDGSGNITRETDALGNYTLFTYSPVGAKLSEEHYDSDDNLMQRKEFTYDANGNKLTETVLVTIDSVVTPLTTTYTYDGNDQVLTETDPRGKTRTFEYDELNRKSAEIDGEGERTEYAYNDIDKITRIDYPDGTSSIYDFDPDGNRSVETTRDGDSTTFTYDALDRITRVDYPDSEHIEKRYDAAGNVTAEIDARGNRTDHEYDSVGRRVRTLQPAVYDPISHTMVRPETNYEYDENGNQTAVVDANGERTEFAFDEEDRLLTTLYPDGHDASSVYDPLGRALSKRDAASNLTLFTYDGMGRLLNVSLPSPDGVEPRPETAYTYDEAGRRLTQTDANGHTTAFEYDAAGNPTAKILPLGQREEFTYDGANRVLVHTDFNGQTRSHTYDGVGRETRLDYSDGSFVSTTYNGEGFPLTITDNRGVTAYTYDVRSRLVTKTGGDGDFAYTHDASGNQTSVTSAGGTTAYTYDALNRLSTVDQGGDVTSYTYDLVGNLVTSESGDGSVATQGYNARNQLVSVVNTRADASVISSYTYDLDANGLRTRVTEEDGTTVDFVYDHDYRLVSETRTGANAYANTYTYDAVGNRVTATRDAAVTTYSYDDNDRLVAENGITYSYDANGNRIAKDDGAGSVTEYGFDGANRLVTVGTPGVIDVEYVYDASGNRVQEKSGTGTVIRNYLVDVINVSGLPQVIEERDGSNALDVRYAYGNDLAAQDRGGARSYFHYDGTGSTRALTNAAGATTDTYLYDGFGLERATAGTTDNRYRFAGEQFDANSGFYYLRARYYDTSTGVFASVDPESGDPMSPPTLHRYVYSGDNPVNYKDPTGRQFDMISVSISISISTSIRSIYTTNLVKFFFKAAKICFCQLEPAYKMQALALDMLVRDVPGAERLLEQSRHQIAASFQAIGREIGNTYKAIANDLVSVKVEINLGLDKLYDQLAASSPFPNSTELQKLADFKETLNKWLDGYSDAMQFVDAVSIGDSCTAFSILDKNADTLLGLVPSF